MDRTVGVLIRCFVEGGIMKVCCEMFCDLGGFDTHPPTRESNTTAQQSRGVTHTKQSIHLCSGVENKSRA